MHHLSFFRVLEVCRQNHLSLNVAQVAQSELAHSTYCAVERTTCWQEAYSDLAVFIVSMVLQAPLHISQNE